MWKMTPLMQKIIQHFKKKKTQQILKRKPYSSALNPAKKIHAENQEFKVIIVRKFRMLACLHARVLGLLGVRTCWRVWVLAWLARLRAYMLAYLGCMRAYVLACLARSRAYFFTCFVCLFVLCPCVLTCLTCLLCSRCYVLTYLCASLTSFILFSLHLKS